MTEYEVLRQLAAQAQDLSAAIGLLSWDQEIYMPPAGIERRANQQGTLAALRHNLLKEKVLPQVHKLQDKDLAEHDRLNVQQLAEALEKALKLPELFVNEQAQLTSQVQHTWEQAKKASDWSIFEPALARMVDSKRKEADYYGYENSPYDALMDSYEPGATTQLIDPVFNYLRKELKLLLEKVFNAQQVDDSFLFQPVDKDSQWQFSLHILKSLGFDFNRGRQDLSTHPFTSGMNAEDVRLTTMIDKDNLQAMLYSTIHEFGHGLYEQGLPPEEYGMPYGEACSLSIHESQSRIWENNVARGLPFCEWMFEELAKVYPDKLNGKTPLDVFKAVNKVERSLIRILADEVTYHYHIMLRYELEKELVEGRLTVKDLPEKWNARIKEYLGMDVHNVGNGALQDIHWSIGAIGYFPTYSLGSLYAAQLYHFAERDLPSLAQDIRQGRFEAFGGWLKEKIHKNGRLWDSETLCKHAVGEGLNPEYFMKYISLKLDAVYDLA